jgi:hypothetical protein
MEKNRPNDSDTPQYLGDEDADGGPPEEDPIFLGDEPPPVGGEAIVRIEKVEVTPWRFTAEGVSVKDKRTLLLLVMAVPMISSFLTAALVLMVV